jgi:FMN phosphatase YigB (HAD superfamily)
MIGDSLGSDIRGGLNAGVDTCWYNPEGFPCPEDTTPTYIVDGFDGIRKIVRG